MSILRLKISCLLIICTIIFLGCEESDDPEEIQKQGPTVRRGIFLNGVFTGVEDVYQTKEDKYKQKKFDEPKDFISLNGSIASYLGSSGLKSKTVYGFKPNDRVTTCQYPEDKSSSENISEDFHLCGVYKRDRKYKIVDLFGQAYPSRTLLGLGMMQNNADSRRAKRKRIQERRRELEEKEIAEMEALNNLPKNKVQKIFSFSPLE